MTLFPDAAPAALNASPLDRKIDRHNKTRRLVLSVASTALGYGFVLFSILERVSAKSVKGRLRRVASSLRHPDTDSLCFLMG